VKDNSLTVTVVE